MRIKECIVTHLTFPEKKTKNGHCYVNLYVISIVKTVIQENKI